MSKSGGGRKFRSCCGRHQRGRSLRTGSAFKPADTLCGIYGASRACMRARHNHCNFTDFLFLSPWESHVRRVNLHLRRLLFCHLNPVCNLSSLGRTRKKIYVNMDYGQWKENYGSCLTKGEYDWSMYPIRIINIVIFLSLLYLKFYKYPITFSKIMEKSRFIYWHLWYVILWFFYTY